MKKPVRPVPVSWSRRVGKIGNSSQGKAEIVSFSLALVQKLLSDREDRVALTAHLDKPVKMSVHISTSTAVLVKKYSFG